jgi:Na+/proline symporter
MERSVLDAGLAVLSWPSGPVLGAFLLGTLAPGRTGGQVLAGMVAGLVAMAVVWGWPLPIAFTWFVFIGAAVTVVVAQGVHVVERSSGSRSVV